MSHSDKKYYQIGTTSEADWDSIHAIMTKDGTLEDNIPNREVECTDYMPHSPTRSTYLLTDEEADELRKHPQIVFVDLEPSVYKELYHVEHRYDANRYTQAVKNYRVLQYKEDSNTIAVIPFDTPVPVAERGRAGFQLYRGIQKTNNMTSPTTPVVSNLTYSGDGSDIDIIVADDGVWIGHVEFCSNAVNGLNPTNYKIGNVLSPTATCGVLDIVLDGPYYIDPDWFDADPTNRLTTRWDGTIVPTELAAGQWWGNENNRSPQFSSMGTVTIDSEYTRLKAQGSNTVYCTAGGHGTNCASLVYGRNFGWAYNANKWMIKNTYPITDYISLTIQKLFHQYKPVNPTYGTRDPTISTNSWGYRYLVPFKKGYAFYRNESPTAFEYDTSVTPNINTRPAFINNFTQETIRFQLKPSSVTTAGDELIAAGVIYCCSAGNTNQKMVNPGHPDYNNFIGPNSDSTIDNYTIEFGTSGAYPTVNRPGFPQQIGKTSTELATIVIGALDDQLTVDNKEQKAYYSNTGEAVDCFVMADGTLSARNIGTGGYPRYDSNTPGGNTCRDAYFNGTSAATPVAAGIIACKLQSNRSWSWRDVKNWIKNNVGELTVNEFKNPTEVTGSTNIMWSDQTNPQGAKMRILWDAETTSGSNLELIVETAEKILTQSQTSVNFRPVRAQGGSGNYTYSVSPALPSGLTLNPSTGYVTGNANVNSLETNYTVSVVDNG